MHVVRSLTVSESMHPSCTQRRSLLYVSQAVLCNNAAAPSASVTPHTLRNGCCGCPGPHVQDVPSVHVHGAAGEVLCGEAGD